MPRVNYNWLLEAWGLFAARAGVWMGATALILAAVALGLALLVGATYALAMSLPAGRPAAAITSSPAGVAWLVGVVVITLGVLYLSVFLACGLHRMAARQVRGEAIAFRDVFSGGPIFWRMLLLSVLSGLALTAATVLCVLPGLVLGGLWLPAPFLVAEGAGVRASLARSLAATKRDWANATLLFVILQGVVSVGVSVGIGLLVVLPLYWLVSALMYRDLIACDAVTGTPP